MREILFKAKRTDTDTWAEGNLLAFDSRRYIINDAESIYHCPQCDREEMREMWFAVIPETVSQFTGLYDKNGVRIWENDIVRYTDLAFNPNIGRFENMIFTSAVTYNLDNGCFSPFEPDTFESYIRAENVEVIGNRFDNPELLKGK